MSVQVKTEWRGKRKKEKKPNARKMHIDIKGRRRDGKGFLVQSRLECYGHPTRNLKNLNKCPPRGNSA